MSIDDHRLWFNHPAFHMIASIAMHRRARVHRKAARGVARGNTVNKGLGMELRPELLDLPAASVLAVGPQDRRVQFEWTAACNAGPEPLTRGKARASLVVNPCLEEVIDEKAY